MRLALTPRYALGACLLLAVELVIGLYMHDRFIRPFVGDLLVVWLIFFLCRSLLITSWPRLLLAVWLFCCAVEFGQYWRLVEVLHLEQVPLARIVIGATFDGNDLLAYTLGALSLYTLLRFQQRRSSPRHRQAASPSIK